MLRIEQVELVVAPLTLRQPWVTGHGTITERPVLLVHVMTSSGEGWGECGALPTPDYSDEYVLAAVDCLRRFLIPAALAAGEIEPETLVELLGWVQGHRMAKAALEEACLDAQLRAEGRSLAGWLGVSRRSAPIGATVSIGALPDLLDQVGALVEDGYRRVKLKIRPGCDVEPLRAVRSAHPDLVLIADANGSYTESLWPVEIDELALACVEQPLAADDLDGHARLAGRILTPICLDEPLRSPGDVRVAVALGACSVVSLKRGRLGGLAATRLVHEWCRTRSLGQWVGGMLDSAVGRSVNATLGAMDGCTIAGDLVPSGYFAVDLAEMPAASGGAVPVSSAPGVTVWPEADRLAAVGASTVERLR